MTFPVTGILDSFNRANTGPPPSANWSTDQFGQGLPGHKVVSNTCVGDANFAASWWNAATYGPDAEVYAQAPTRSATVTHTMELQLRMVDPGTAAMDGYDVRMDPNGGSPFFAVVRMDNIVNTILGATVSAPFVAGDWMGGEATGSEISVYRKPSGGDWVRVASRVDTTYPDAGYIGMYTDRTASSWDDFGGGEIPRVSDAPETLRVTTSPLRW